MICALGEEDYITNVTVYTKLHDTAGTEVVCGLQFFTGSGSCGGVMGMATDDVIHTSGHALRYISVRMGGQMDKISLHYDYNCQINT